MIRLKTYISASLTFVILNALLVSCMNRAIEYEYSDGSANRYVITPDSLEYIPVQPHESSTGSYSGGVPKKIAITAETYGLITQALDAALLNKAIHTDQRAKMTGLVRVKSKRVEAIISPGVELATIDSLFKATLGSSK